MSRLVQRLPSWSLDAFRKAAFVPQLPAILPANPESTPPALSKWFNVQDSSLARGFWHKYGDVSVPVEMTRYDDGGNVHFESISMPLNAFTSYMSHRQEAPKDFQLYLAQCRVSGLPAAIGEDLPTPELVLKAGKGDLYDTNIWIGRGQTYTPLHRDPNPNLLQQLIGSKKVRMYPPEIGRSIFDEVQEKLGRAGSGSFRGEEMMMGEERKVLEQQVWDDDSSSFISEAYDAEVHSGEALFIPLKWWHSIKGTGKGTTASVNWWFR